MSYKRELAVFFVLVFTWTWGIAALMILAPDWVERTFGEMSQSNVLFVAAVYAPTLLGISVESGVQGPRRLCPAVGPAGSEAVCACGVVLRRSGRSPRDLLAFWTRSTLVGGVHRFPRSLRSVCFWLRMTTDFLSDPGPVGEEFGWRGFALPRLLEMMTPRAASLVLGAIWAVWHLPAFFISGTPQTRLSLPIFLLGAGGAVCGVYLALLRTSGSLLLAILFNRLANSDPTNVLFEHFAIGLAVMAVALLLFGGYGQNERQWPHGWKTPRPTLRPSAGLRFGLDQGQEARRLHPLQRDSAFGTPQIRSIRASPRRGVVPDQMTTLQLSSDAHEGAPPKGRNFTPSSHSIATPGVHAARWRKQPREGPGASGARLVQVFEHLSCDIRVAAARCEFEIALQRPSWRPLCRRHSLDTGPAGSERPHGSGNDLEEAVQFLGGATHVVCFEELLRLSEEFRANALRIELGHRPKSKSCFFIVSGEFRGLAPDANGACVAGLESQGLLRELECSGFRRSAGARTRASPRDRRP